MHTGYTVASITDNRNKGVICEITPEDEMFTDEYGNVADLVIFSRAVSARMNNDQAYEHYMNGYMEAVRGDCAKMMEQNKWSEAWEHMKTAMSNVAPNTTYQSIMRFDGNPERQKRFLTATCTGDGLPHYTVLADSTHINEELYMAMMAHRRPNFSKITFTNYKGERETLLKEGLIAIKTVGILEKTAHNALAANSARTQHHGFPNSSSIKNSMPGNLKELAPKVFSETEARMMSNVVGATTVARIAQMSNDQVAAEDAAGNMFEFENPQDCREMVNRDKIPLGNHKAKQLLENDLLCMGAQIEGIDIETLRANGVR